MNEVMISRDRWNEIQSRLEEYQKRNAQLMERLLDIHMCQPIVFCSKCSEEIYYDKS